MSNKQSILGVICVALLLPTHASGQKPASVTALQDPPRIETFTKTATGDWQTAIRTPDGLTREYVYSPPNKVAPVVDVHIDVAERSGGVRLIYRYRVKNQASALQELAWLWIGSVQPSLVHEVPQGWRNVSPQHPGTMSFYGPPNGKYLAGIPPGDSGMFTLEAAALPGVVTLRAMGHTGGAVEIPEGLTPRQRQDLLKLSENVTVNLPTIGPAIPAGLGAPELTFDVVLARVGAHYVEQMEIYGHPEAAAVRKIVEQIVRPGAQLADPVVRKGLERLGDVASRQTADSWHRELSRALAVTIRVLSSGAVPIKG